MKTLKWNRTGMHHLPMQQHMRLILLLLLFWVLAGNLFSQQNFFFWSKLDGQYAFNDTFRVEVELMHRRQEINANDLHFLRLTQANILRFWLHYRTGKKNEFLFSPVAYFETQIKVKENESVRLAKQPEWRWSGGARQSFAVWQGNLSFRNLYELRLFPTLPESKQIRGRVRHKLDYNFPVPFRLKADVWTEYFWTLHPEVGFNHLRIGSSLYIPLSPKLIVSPGYFLNTVPSEWTDVFRDNHIFTLYLTYHIR